MNFYYYGISDITKVMTRIYQTVQVCGEEASRVGSMETS